MKFQFCPLQVEVLVQGLKKQDFFKFFIALGFWDNTWLWSWEYDLHLHNLHFSDWTSILFGYVLKKIRVLESFKPLKCDAHLNFVLKFGSYLPEYKLFVMWIMWLMFREKITVYFQNQMEHNTFSGWNTKHWTFKQMVNIITTVFQRVKEYP